jgi:hypothetical protein
MTTVGVLLRADQTDEVVEAAVDWDASLLEHGSKVSLFARENSRAKCMRFIDGSAKAIAFGTGEVYKRGPKPEDDELGARFVLDEQGKTRWRYTTTKSRKYYVRLRHPYYGEWTYDIPLNKEEYTWRLPVVRLGTVEYERSIRGRMVNDANEPVSGVLIRVERVYPQGGDVVYATGSVRSDEQGYFHLYPLMWPESAAKVGNLVPVRSCYEAWIEPPRETGLACGTVCIPNDGRYAITIARGQFHTFAFEDGQERLTEENDVSAFRLYVDQPDRPTLTYLHRQFKNGLVLPPGTYSIADWGQKYEFDPLEVTEDSPEELVFSTKFKRSDVMRYEGSVVHGITGDSIEGAFVVAVSNGGTLGLSPDLPEFTPEDWEKLYMLPSRFSVNKDVAARMALQISSRKGAIAPGEDNVALVVEEAIQPVHKLWGVIKGVRTGADGRFTLELDRSEKFHSLVFFEQGYLGIRRMQYSLTNDGDGEVQTGAVPLFPAAKVTVKVNVVGGRERVIPQWIIDPNDCPEWVRQRDPEVDYEGRSDKDSRQIEQSGSPDFRDEPKRVRTLMDFDYGRWGDFTYSHDITPGRKTAVQVPAGVKLKLQIRSLMDSEHEWAPHTYPQVILLEQDQTLDLGDCEIRESIYVYVSIVDEQGNPVEGIPVDDPIDGPPEQHPWDPWKGRHNTDANGWVRFNVYPGMKGRFTITCEKHKLQESLAFDIKQDDKTGREFIFKISDSLRKHFVGE